jgi:murein biosynthesis integral membrane protein MurJ
MSVPGRHGSALAGKLAGRWRPPAGEADGTAAGIGASGTGEAAAAAGDSLTAAAWTMVSRVTGVVRIAVIGAVLGPTFFGNTYQFTNTLPNLVYYGFLAGQLFSSLLVPALVRHLDAGDRRAAEHVAGGFLGLTLAATAIVAPLAVAIGPLLLRFAALGGGPGLAGAAQVHVARLLILMFIPQIFCYAVVAASISVMNSRKRFALPAGAPSIENLGTIAVLGITAALYGTGSTLGRVPAGELLLLGFGSTGAVALHAATQWWGARRAGVVLLPRTGWREPEVQVVARRALPALGQAGLFALQMLALLAGANRLPGGVVAFQIALNFYFLADAIGTTPVALSLLPRLSRMHLDGDATAFHDTLVRGWALGFFVTVPAAVAYLVLAVPLARALSFGRMASPAGVTMVAVSLALLSVAVIGQTAFLIATYASYARKDTRSPLLASVVQAVTCLGLVSVVLLVHGTAVLAVLGLAVSASVCAAACYLTARMRRHLSRGRARRLTPSLARFVAGAALMAGPAWLSATVIPRWLGPPSGTWAGIVVAALVGAGVYVGVQAFWRTEELDWLTGGFTLLRGKAVRVVTAAAMRGASLLRGLRDRAGGGVRRIGYPRIGYPRQWDGRRLSRPSSRWLLFPAIVVAAGAGAAVTLGPLKAMASLLILLLLAAVCRWPPLAAHLVVVVTPLTVGISRGSVLPLIRPNEAVDLVVAAGLAARGIARLRTGRIPRLRLDGVERAIVLMAVFNSVLPLLWMRFRQQPVTQDDLLYALVMWKFLGLYVIVRLSVGTNRQIRRCLWLSVAAASVVAVVAILQSLNLLGVSGLVSTYYAYTGNGPVAAGARGSSTLGLPAATADLMIFNLAIVSGLWARYRRHRFVLGASAALFVAGALAAGEFSSALGLLIGVVCIAVVSGSPRLLALFIPAGLAGSGVLRSVIAGRLSGFRSPAGVPASWLDRISNLRTYFWPKLFSDWNFVLGVRPLNTYFWPQLGAAGNWVLGVRPSARVPAAHEEFGWVWIESGYTWLLWAGGIPLLASYVYFVVATVRRGWLAARHGAGAASVAGAAAFVAVLVTTVLMIFDPHLTYRGSADVLFVLIALAAPLRAHRGALSNEAGCPHEAAMHGDGGSIVRPDDENTARDAKAPWPSSFSPDGNARGSREPAGPRAGRDHGATSVNTAEFRRHPGIPGQLPRFLRAHLASIVAIAVAVTAGAALLAGMQTREYKSQAAVVVYPATSQASNETQATVMGTEQAIALSGAVTAIASQRLHVPEGTLHAGLTVSAAANSYLLVLSVKDPDPRVARRNAQAIADAYVAYRTAAQRAAPNGRPTTPVAPVGAVNAAVITPASLPRTPSSPDLAVDVGAGLILGIVLGLGFALIRDRMDDRLRGPADLESQSTVPVLAVVPAVQGGRPDHADGLEMLRRPGSAAADAFRNLRTRVVQVAAWRHARTILVASAAGEEPALVSGNLAAALALAGRHVVLVCVDPRRARPQEMFNVTGRIGLTSVLDGNADLAEAIQCTDVRGLEILPAGPVSGDPAAVPQAPELPGVLDAIRREADFVIIDAPPVLAGPDTSVLAELAEMMLLAADARRSTRTDVRTAARAMEQVHRVLEGCVLVNAGRGRRLPKLPAGPRLWLRRPLSRAWARVPIRHTGGTTPAPEHSDTT